MLPSIAPSSSTKLSAVSISSELNLIVTESPSGSKSEITAFWLAFSSYGGKNTIDPRPGVRSGGREGGRSPGARLRLKPTVSGAKFLQYLPQYC